MPNPSQVLDAAAKARREGRMDDFRVLMQTYDELSAPPSAPVPAAPTPQERRPVRAAARPVAASKPPVAAPAPAPAPAPTPAPARPVATVQSLAERAAALRLAGENDKAVLVEKQIDAIRAREKKQAAEKEAEVKATEALAKGREAAAAANVTARETDVRPVGIELPESKPAEYVPLPGSRADIEDIDRVARERARKTLELRNLPFSEEQGLIELEKQKEKERRAATISATGGVEEGPKPLVPMLRPTRMEDVPTFQFPYIEPVGTARLYRDPDTGELREPTSVERFTEALARQPVMSESEALAVAAEKIENPEARAAVKNILTQRIEGEGIIETPLGASLRSLGTLTPAFLNTTFMPILTEGLGVKSERGTPVAFGADPAAKRKVDETLGYFDQISQGIEQGRGIGDELAQMPGLVKATAEAFGENEEYARNVLWGTGTLGEIFLPITPLSLPGKAASFVGKGAKAVAPAKYAKAAEAGKAVTRGIQDRALLGTMARRTYPEAAKVIPAFGKEDDIVKVVAKETGIPAEEVRTTLRAQVPDDLVQISDSVAAPRAVAAKEREAARATVDQRYRFAPQRPSPEVVAREVDDILVKRAEVPSSGLQKLDDLSVRSLNPTPEGLEPSLFDGVVARSFLALAEDQKILNLGNPTIRPDNALAASLYNKVRNASFRASQDLRDDILKMAKEIPEGTPVAQAEELLTAKIFDRYFAQDPEKVNKLVDKFVEDGLSTTQTRRSSKEALEELIRDSVSSLFFKRQYLPGQKIEFSDVLDVAKNIAERGGVKANLKVRKTLPIMASTIIEDIAKPSIVGERGSSVAQLAELQRGRPARAGEVAVGPKGALVSPRTTTGGEWASGLDSAFRPQDMFEPKALNAAWTDSIKDSLEAGLGLRKRVGLYLQSQFGPIPNLPAWTDRFIRGAMISASQIGLFRTGTAATDAYKIANAAPGQILFTTSDGIRWTPELIASEGRRLGLGLSAQDAARQGAANRVLVQRVQNELLRRAPKLRRAVGALDPRGPDYAALAGGVSDAYRQAVFAGGLKAGMRAEDAAALARRSLLDYSKTDNFLMEKVTPYFASAAETWESARALGDALARGTNVPIQAIRVENFMSRKEDPFSRQGDASRRAFYSLRFPVGDKQYEAFTLTNPVVWAVEGGLGTMAMLDGGVVTVNELLKGSETLSGAGAQAVVGVAKLIGSALLGELEPKAPAVQAAPEAGKLTESEMLALMVHLSEPDGPYPGWRPFIDANFPLDLVNPPKGAAIPGYEGTKIWGNLPSDWREKGLIWKRVSDEELAGFPAEQQAVFEQFAPVRVYKPSTEAKAQLRGIRSALPGVLQDSIRWYASDEAQKLGRQGQVGIPASEPSPTIAGAELLLRRGIREVGADERAAVEALRATRAGE